MVAVADDGPWQEDSQDAEVKMPLEIGVVVLGSIAAEAI